MTQSFIDFSREIWGQHWAICRKTPHNLARYDRCLTNREYDEGRKAWAATNPIGYAREEHGEVAANLLKALQELLVWADAPGVAVKPGYVADYARSAIAKATGHD